MKARFMKLLGLFVIISMMITPASAQTRPPLATQDDGPQSEGSVELLASKANNEVLYEEKGATGPATYIIQLEAASLASYRGNLPGMNATSPSVTGASKLDTNSPASRRYRDYLAKERQAVLSQIEQETSRSVEVLYTYDVAYNGMAVVLTPEEAAQVAQMPGVVRVIRDFKRYVQTDTSPEYLDAVGLWDGTNTGGLPGTQGEGMVVGIIDTGINMDNRSFADVGDDGYNHTNPRGHYYGWCDPTDPNYDAALVCNDKLIGVYSYPASGDNPEDDHSHGSHTASTTAGNVVYSATLQAGLIFDQISGMAPHANIIAYDVCISTGCQGASIMAAIDDAVADQVDVINYSIGGGPTNPWIDPDSLAFLGARDAGVFVAISAGNDGPGEGTVGSPSNSPWVTTAANGTHNRGFEPNEIVNMQGGTPPADMTGTGVSGEYTERIVYAGDYGNALCGLGSQDAPTNPFAPNTWSGEIVVCDRGTYYLVDKAAHVLAAGAGGVVIANTTQGTQTYTTDFGMPGIHINQVNGTALRAWLIDTETIPYTATITASPVLHDDALGGIMNISSSRGPNVNADILKPDIMAPGTNILAAYAGDANSIGLMSGTSMASPHVAGAATLIRALHPEWTPAEVQSALMMTSWTENLLKEDAATPADPFDVGSGRLDLTSTALAGLVLNETKGNYEAADPGTGGDPKTLNLASLANQECPEECTWTRTFRSVLDTAETYTATSTTPAGLTVSVTPETFTIAPGATQVVTITVNADLGVLPADTWAFAQLQLTNAGDLVHHLPIAVWPVPNLPALTLEPEALESTQAPNTTKEDTLVIGNDGFADLEWEVVADPAAPMMWDQPVEGDSGLISDYFTGSSGGVYSADDFELMLDTTVVSITVPGFWNSGDINNATMLNWYIYPDDNGSPAGDPEDGLNLHEWTYSAAPGSVGITIANNDVSINVIAATGNAIALPAGRYWLSFYPSITPAVGTNRWNWSDGTPRLSGTNLIDPHNFFGAGFTNWTNMGGGQAFLLEGTQDCTTGIMPWLTLDATSGTVAPNSSQDVNITFDSDSLALGTYTGAVCLATNDPAHAAAVVPVTLNVQDMPQIEVDPESLATFHAPDVTSTTLPVTITNVGNLDLDWEIFDTILVTDWSENFDTYAAGSQVIGQGGWDGWGGALGAGALVTDTVALSSPNAIDIVGDTDLVHQYAGFTTGVWDYVAYSYVPSDFDGESYFILLNTYATTPRNWSVEVFFDSASGEIVNTGASGGSLEYTPDQWVEIRVRIDLDNDTANFYYDNQLLYSGTWTDEQSANGALNIGALNLYADGATSVFYDDLSLTEALPGLPEACDAVSAMPWVSTSPVSGTIASLGDSMLDVTFDSTGLDAGEYTGGLCITSNDPTTPYQVIPLALEVQGLADLSIVKEAPAAAYTGGAINYTLTISNAGPDGATGVTVVDTLPLSVTFAAASPGCVEASGVVTCDVGDLAMDETVVLTITAAAPAVAVELTNTAEVSSNEVDPELDNNVDTAVTTVAEWMADLAIVKDAPAMVYPGNPLTYTLTISNAGPDGATGVTVMDTLPISVTFVSASAGCSVDTGVVTCAIGDMAVDETVVLTITVTTPDAEVEITNTAEVSGNEADPDLDNNEASVMTLITTSMYKLFLPVLYR